MPKPKVELFEIWRRQKELTRDDLVGAGGLAEDEFVEDAGLEAEEVATPAVRVAPATRNKRVRAA